MWSFHVHNACKSHENSSKQSVLWPGLWRKLQQVQNPLKPLTPKQHCTWSSLTYSLVCLPVPIWYSGDSLWTSEGNLCARRPSVSLRVAWAGQMLADTWVSSQVITPLTTPPCRPEPLVVFSAGRWNAPRNRSPVCGLHPDSAPVHHRSLRCLQREAVGADRGECQRESLATSSLLLSSCSFTHFKSFPPKWATFEVVDNFNSDLF